MDDAILNIPATKRLYAPVYSSNISNPFLKFIDVLLIVILYDFFYSIKVLCDYSKKNLLAARASACSIQTRNC